ncbi:transglycosylase SLT domain-containing protein [Nitratireductor aquimarinus]|uniref:Transglycosylase SLT domain-containing protein n=1 Tax=Nitratireductor aquimarinus TaxID=889300 RepID=A0ABU4AFJ5_9HYPH|nr:transglycosylase SLT domain-containing protein [Nitratireductor aquimarinus]MDV6225004.1 transglycosylase SLT domain-containing protein [Nitratireductor aquimarinus]
MKITTLFAAAFAVCAATSLSHADEPRYSQVIATHSAKKAAEKKVDTGKEPTTLLQAIIRGGKGSSATDVDMTTTGSIKADKKTVKKALQAKSRKSTKTAKASKSRKKTTVKTSVRKSGSGGSYHTIISKYAAAYGVPVSLANAVVRVESNYRANARGAAGEIGLMQIKPATARMMGYSGSSKGLYNPETNIKYGMKYLAKAHKLGGGSTCGTILKYNAGHGAKRMNPISSRYCSKVKQILGH